MKKQNEPSRVGLESMAEKALKQGDCIALKGAFNKAMDDINKLIAGYSVVLDRRDSPLPAAEPETVVVAMRDVSLAAIALAREVAAKTAGKET